MPDAVAPASPLAAHAFAVMSEATLAERPIHALVQVAAWHDTVPQVDALLARARLPSLPRPRRASVADGATALDIGPGIALFVDGPPDLLARLSAALPVVKAVVTDLSHARTRLVLSGRRAPWILSKGIQIDLHDRSFPVGACAQTQFDRIGVTLHRAGAEDWHLYAYRGLALSLVETLETAGRADVPA